MRRASFAWRAAAALPLMAAAMVVAGCGGDDGTGPAFTLDQVAGVYDPVKLTFDPQGSVPPADILAALVSSGIEPELNIARTGAFDIFFRDPDTGEVTLLEGHAEATSDGARLTFDSQADANKVLLPRFLTLAFDEAEGTLSFSGNAQLSRARLLQLFPDLYGDEQLLDPTPGTLTVEFDRTTSATT